MSSNRSVTPDSPDQGPYDTVEAHYASLERGIPCSCYGGYHYIGHMVEDPESGEEVEVHAPVPCRRCSETR